MKKLSAVLSLILIFALLFGCKSADKQQDTGSVQLGNPWKSYESLSEAENACGFKLGISENIAGFTAEVYRVMTDSLLEVKYKNGDHEVTVRKQMGEGEDISGDYTEYPNVNTTVTGIGTVTERTDGAVTSAIISAHGCSWSVYAPSDAAESFIAAIIGE